MRARREGVEECVLIGLRGWVLFHRGLRNISGLSRCAGDGRPTDLHGRTQVPTGQSAWSVC